jgi:hypothetical protein
MVRVAGDGIRDCRDDLLGVEGVQDRASRGGRLLERLLMQCQCVQSEEVGFARVGNIVYYTWMNRKARAERYEVKGYWCYEAGKAATCMA